MGEEEPLQGYWVALQKGEAHMEGLVSLELLLEVEEDEWVKKSSQGR